MSPALTYIEKEDERLFNTRQKWYVRKKWVEYSIIRKDKNNRGFIRLLTLTCTQVYEIKLLLDNNLLLLKDSRAFDPRCLAFCEMSDHRFALIQGALPGAKYFKGRLEDLVGAGRVGFGISKVDAWFPFDVINLDINESILKRNSRIMEAIRKLFIIQNMRRQSFTLFLTISSVREGDYDANIETLRQSFNRNLSDPEIEREFLEKHPNGTFEQYHDFQSITIPKKIVEYGLSQGFDTRCNERFTYVGQGLSTRMVSLIFECEYLGSSELEHLAEIRRNRILEILENDCKDVNQILEQDAEVSELVMKLKSKFSQLVS